VEKNIDDLNNKGNIFHKRTALNWIGFLIFGVILSLVLYLLFENENLTIFIFIIFFIVAIYSYLVSKCVIATIGKEFLTMYFGLPLDSRKVQVAYKDIENADVISIDKKVYFGPSIITPF
jgi:hypothetical protein